MATKLTKPVRRETDVTHDGRPIIVAMSSEGIVLREKGRRTTYTLPYRYAFVQAARLHADAKLAAKRAARGAKPRRVRRSLLTRGR